MLHDWLCSGLWAWRNGWRGQRSRRVVPTLSTVQAIRGEKLMTEVDRSGIYEERDQLERALVDGMKLAEMADPICTLIEYLCADINRIADAVEILAPPPRRSPGRPKRSPK
jgi:hypothetical protein